MKNRYPQSAGCDKLGSSDGNHHAETLFPFKKLHHFYRALFHTGAAVAAFGVIHYRNSVDHLDALLRAVFHAEFAFDASGFAAFGNLGFNYIHIGTQSSGSA
jgi:hypothetical protein